MGKGRPLIYFLKQSAPLIPLLGKSTTKIFNGFLGPLSQLTDVVDFGSCNQIQGFKPGWAGTTCGQLGLSAAEMPPESLGQQGLRRGHSPGSLPWVWCGP